MTITADLTRFAVALRAAGVHADTSRVVTSVAALAELDPADIEQVYWATRLTMCAEPDDLERFDAEFDSFFRGRTRTVERSTVEVVRMAASTSEPGEGADDGDAQVLRTAASAAEVLRSHDIGAMAVEERIEIEKMISLLTPRLAKRRTLRMRPGGHQRVDLARTVRTMLRDGGEPGRLVWQQRRNKPRRLVLLLDVSGSMTPYADALLRFAHAAVRVAPASTEVFTIGTRLTRITRQLRARDPELALRAAGAAVPDWSGGTRLGDALQAFLDLWGQRGTARRAVVVVASDGWERGDATVLGEQMGRLARLAHRVIWANPHKGKEGFAPLTGGMVACLPHVDSLVAGHSFEAFFDLAEVIAHA
jgi:uncharacterized protein